MQKQGDVFVSSSIARYKPYGGYLTQPTATALDRGYTGHDRTAADDDLDLIYMNARYLDSSTGRFISADTLVPEPGNPQAFNRYSYAVGNPVGLVDPSGHFSEEAIWKYLWDYCNGDHACSHAMYDTWKSDSEWWTMLSHAEAGDVMFVSGGRYFAFQGQGQHTLNGIAYSTWNGVTSAWTTDDAFYNLTLMNLFNDEGGTWGGWFDIEVGQVHGVYHRYSQTTAYWYKNKSLMDRMDEGVAYGFAAAVACAPLTPEASVICGTFASGIAPIFGVGVDHYYDLAEPALVVNSAGHIFVYKPEFGERLNEDTQRYEFGIIGYSIYIYSPNHYRAAQILKVTY